MTKTSPQKKMDSTTKNNVETTSTEDKPKDTEQDARKDTTLQPKEIERSSSPFEYQKVSFFDPLSNNNEKELAIENSLKCRCIVK